MFRWLTLATLTNQYRYLSKHPQQAHLEVSSICPSFHWWQSPKVNSNVYWPVWRIATWMSTIVRGATTDQITERICWFAQLAANLLSRWSATPVKSAFYSHSRFASKTNHRSKRVILSFHCAYGGIHWFLCVRWVALLVVGCKLVGGIGGALLRKLLACPFMWEGLLLRLL